MRYSLRTIRKTGPLSLAVVVTLIVGVGMNAVVFSLFNALLFRPHVASRKADHGSLRAARNAGISVAP